MTSAFAPFLTLGAGRDIAEICGSTLAHRRRGQRGRQVLTVQKRERA